MQRWISHTCVLFLIFVSFSPTSRAQTSTAGTPRKSQRTAAHAKPDLAKQPTLYVVGYAHLDTEWRWEYPLVIREYLSKTLRNNFALFEKYPDYIFNFSGANQMCIRDRCERSHDLGSNAESWRSGACDAGCGGCNAVERCGVFLLY